MAKITNKPAENAKNNNEVNKNNVSANTNKPAETKAETKVETKVVAIPVDALNKKNDTVKVVINGKETQIKRGKQQIVSKDVYERLVIAGYVVEG